MSLRDKAREVREAGAEARGNYAPRGVPLRAYNYWLENSVSDYARQVKAGTRRENFCHYWRVVAIWSPLHRLGNAMTPVFNGIGKVLGPVGDFLYRHREKIGTIILGALVLLALGCVGMLLWAIHADFGWMGYVWAVVGIAGVAIAGLVLFGVIVGIATLFETLRAYRRRPVVYDEFDEDDDYEPAPVEYKEPRKPGFISRFFSGIGDFLVLIAQVVRVNKWKICPLVDVKPKVGLEK